MTNTKRADLRRLRQLEYYTIPSGTSGPPEVAAGTSEDDIAEFLEKVSGQRNFLPVRFLADGALRAEAVCRVLVSTVGAGQPELGTGLLIGPNTIMTNNHVIEDRMAAARSVAEFFFEEGRAIVRVALAPGALFITNKALDFSIVALERGLVDDVQPIPLKRGMHVLPGERVNIIQHPRGRKKEVALQDNEVIDREGEHVRYRTDTERGSSGSPVFNERWDLVALHHQGVEEDDGTATNQGVRIDAILNYLVQRSVGSDEEEAAKVVLSYVHGTDPDLGFFDYHGVFNPQEVEVQSFSGNAEYADVGFWNIEHFNSSISPDRLERVASVVADLRLDVMGLVEVERGALDQLRAVLLRRGFDYRFVYLDVTGRQDLAVLYNADTARVTLNEDIGERFKDQLDARTRAGKSAFPRDPLFANCGVRRGDASVSFLMSVLHLKAFGDAQSQARRALAATKLAEIVDTLRQEDDAMPIVIGGDFNELLTNDVLAPLTDSPDLFALTMDDASTDAITYVGRRYRSLIDHIIVSKDAQLGSIQGDDAAIVRLDRSVADFAEDISDHVPVVFRMVIGEATDTDTGDDGPARSESPSVPVPSGARWVKLNFE